MEYIPNTPDEQRQMLKTIGVDSIGALLEDIPPVIRLNRHLRLPEPLSELELKSHLLELSERNTDLVHHACFLGAGAYDHFVPSVVAHLAFRSEFYTSYTPYQAEMSQGLLQTIYEFQTMIAEMCGMEVANASLYDGASALAEAAMMGIRVTRRHKILVSGGIHPSHRAVLSTYLSGTQSKTVEIPHKDGVTDLNAVEREMNEDAAILLIQSPNYFGCLESVEDVAARVHQGGALLALSVDPISLGLIQAPGAVGADIVVGEGQSLGNTLSFGGPYLGFFATRAQYVRQMPGRVVGATTDSKGRRGFCLTLQTREQHIKRERATSNICTNEALAALCATIYLSIMGKEGIREVGQLCLQKAHYLKQKICAVEGFDEAFTHPIFKEFVIRTPVSPSTLNKRLLKSGIIGGLDLGKLNRSLKHHWLLCVTEKRTRQEMDRLVQVIQKAASG